MYAVDPKMSNVAVSVIVPTYNHAQHVLKALDSVFAQSFKNFEVIVVNDGSPDNTAEVLRPLAQAGKINYLEQSNAGQAAARNRGLAQARGELIAFLDDDDAWPSDNLEAQTRILRAAPLGVVACAGQCRYVSDAVLRDPTPVVDEALAFERLLLRNCIVSPGQVLIRKSALEAVGGFGAVRKGADDWDCWLRLAKHGRLIASPRTALHYTLHQSNASRDAISMLSSATELISIHTKTVSASMRKEAFRSLLAQASIFVANQMTRAIGRSNFKEVGRGAKCLLTCLNHAGWSVACIGVVARAFQDAFRAVFHSRLRMKTE